MKKRLLITSALMTAVLGASLATGTYAWYAATTTGGLNAAESNATVTTTSQSHTVGSDASVELVFTAHAGNDKVELTNSDGVTMYIDANGNKYTKTTGDGTGGYDISAEWVGTVSDDTKAALETKTVTFVVSADGQVKLLTEDDASKRDADNEIEITVTVGKNGALTVSQDKIYYAVAPTNENGPETGNPGGTISSEGKAA